MSSHRGLSAVVGTVFLVAVVIGALSYVSYSMDVLGNFSESLIAEESRQKDKQGEAFEISSIDVTGANKLDGVIKNTGEIPLKITTLWIDEQGINDVVQKYTLDAEIAPGNTVDLSSLVDVDMDSTKGYNMKVVSSRGEVNSFYVNSLADENVYMRLTANPSIIPSTFTSTLLFTVVNNMSNGNYLYNLTPSMNSTKQTISESSAGLLLDITGPIPLTYESLGPGEVAVFSYEISLTGETDNDLQLFNVTLANANPGNEALSSVSIKAVPLATDAGSALTSLGLTDSDSDLTDVLYFHTDSTLTPSGQYPMDGSSPGSAGLTKSPNGNTLEFITTGMTAITTLPAGEFNVALTYFSSPVVVNLPEPSFAFMMDEKDSGDTDEIADMINLFDPDKGFKEGGGKPEFAAGEDPNGAHTTGPDPNGRGEDAGFFHMDDGDYFYDDWNVDGGAEDDYTEPNDEPDTTAMWIRMEATSFASTPLLVWHDWDSGHNDRYGFWMIDGGEIRYGWNTEHDHDSISSVYCDSPLEYDDDLWHHVVGVRDSSGAHSCSLYIDGKLVVANSETRAGDDLIEVDAVTIGSDESEQEFDGDIASLIHWNDDELSAAQVEDLFYTNYGNNATRLTFSVEHVDTDGVTVLDTVIPATEIEIPFYDPSLGNTNNEGNPWVGLHSSNTTDKKYGLFNMTATSASEYSLGVGEMLKVTLDWEPWGDEHNLPINIMFDDSSGWTLPDGPTYMQTPPPDPRWPSYLSFAYDEQVIYRAFNEGPGGIWFVYSGTRLVLTSNDELTSYAAVPHYVNKTTQPTPSDTYALISPDQDSIYIPDQYYAEIDFYQLQSPPSSDNSPPSVNEVPNCDYDAALYLQGYTEGGETFKKTVSLGLVHIYGNPSADC